VAPTRTTIWAVGFDFADTPGLTVNGLQAIDCSVNELGNLIIHMEDVPTKENFVHHRMPCYQRRSRSPDPTYGTDI